jgi:SAM-dependent methyltransferase
MVPGNPMKLKSTASQHQPLANQPAHDKEFWAENWSSVANTVEPPDAPTWINDRDRMLMDFVLPYLPPEGVFAELGCGSARLLARVGLARPGSKLIAIDYEAQAVRLVQETARAYGVPIEAHLGDVNRLAFADGSFDVVLSGGLLEHFTNPQLVLSEMVRTLKPGGVLLAWVVPRKTFSFHRPLHRILGPQVYRTSYLGRHYERWLRELGLEEVRSLSKGLYPPLFHHLPTLPRRAIERTFRAFDGTWLADWLGYFFFVAGRKRR